MDTKKLRQKILDLAIHGKLVPQDPNDEPASVLLERIRAEKEQLVKEGKIKKSKDSKTSDTPHYENVPFEIPSSWEWTTLENILELVSGQDFPPEKYNANVSGIPYIIGASNINNEQLVINRWTGCPSVYSYLNDLLVVCKGAGIGKMAINNIGTVHIARQIQAVRVYTNYINIRYIKAVIKNNIENIISKANGLIPGLKRGLLLSLQIPLPPFSEQQRIIAEIEKWFALIDIIENGKTDLQTTIKQIKSKVLDLAIHGKLVPQDPNNEPASALFKRINPNAEITCDNGQYEKIPKGWYLCLFGEYLDVRDGTHDSPKYVDKGYPFVTSKNLNNGKIDFDSVKFISEEDHMKFSQRSFVEDGDILFAMIGSIGNPVLVVKNREFSIKNVALFKPYDRKNTYMEYVLYYLLYIQETLKLNAKGGMQPFIPLSYFRKDLHLPLPPIAEQHRIVAKIEELFNLLDQIEKSLEA